MWMELISERGAAKGEEGKKEQGQEGKRTRIRQRGLEDADGKRCCVRSTGDGEGREGGRASRRGARVSMTLTVRREQPRGCV